MKLYVNETPKKCRDCMFYRQTTVSQLTCLLLNKSIDWEIGSTTKPGSCPLKKLKHRDKGE